jgi:hypothetical protein
MIVIEEAPAEDRGTLSDAAAPQVINRMNSLRLMGFTRGRDYFREKPNTISG